MKHRNGTPQKFMLVGKTVEMGDKFLCTIKLETPGDGRISTMESPVLYDTEEEAKKALADKLKEILDHFQQDGDVEIVSHRMLSVVK